jgi:hypothetical protein
MLERTPCGSTGNGRAEGWFPVNPFLALQYHFGMLLGVDDLETEQGYHRGKHQMHQAWLHGKGVVWGLDVSINAERELMVTPGLAVDGMGRDLHLDTSACLDLAKWYDANKDEPGFEFADVHGGRRFTVHVVARFDACKTRPVPSIADPCDSDSRGTSFARALETIALELRPGAAPAPWAPYHRLRVLFHLEPDSAAFADVIARRDTILALPADQQPEAYLKAFREFAALDVIDLGPQTGAGGERASLFPEEPTEVPLANVIDVLVMPAGAGATVAWKLTDPLPAIVTTIRPSHVATRTIQELLCGPLFSAVAGGGGQPVVPPPAQPVGNDEAPRVDRDSVDVTQARVVRLDVDRRLAPTSVAPDGFSVSRFTAPDGWTIIKVQGADLDATGKRVALKLGESMGDGLVRIIAYGTGPQPLLSTGLVPLAGAIGDPPLPPFDGRDFVHMVRR